MEEEAEIQEEQIEEVEQDVVQPVEEKPKIEEEEHVVNFMFAKKEEVKKLPCCIITPNDSVNPSYTNLVLPYRVVCRQRYRRAGAKQRAQFAKEVKQHELLQTNALDGVRVHREFCNPIVTPPRASEIIRLTEKQKRKLEEILKRNY